MSMALFSWLLRESFPGTTLKRLRATFRVPVRPNQALTVRGVMTEKHAADRSDFIECDLALESEEGERWVTGTASVHVPLQQ
jgi:acyl dehydratase